MLVSMEWLAQYVDIEGLTARDIADKLTLGGVEVDLIHARDTGLKNVVVGYVTDKEAHPNADKLSVCQVDIGEGDPVTIVCGAPNVAQGQYVPVAKVGGVLPDIKIKKAKLRGVESQGMICSAQELGLDEKMLSKEQAEGILALSGTPEVGTDITDHLGLNDEVLELDLTPNRADCLSMIGVAYEVAALFDRELKLPEVDQESQGEPQSVTEGTGEELPAAVRLEAGDDCPLYALQVVKNVSLGPSPQWMQNRLTAAGIRPINNVVDITNYVMLEYGQPLHAFDYEKVTNGTIVVRHAADGETFVTLDGVERTLGASTVLITDGERPVAIGGVMGGENSEITSDTHTVLLESAYFNAPSISKTSRQLGLRTEASARFEKKVDLERVLPALRRATALLCAYAGGKVASREVSEQVGEAAPKAVRLSYKRMEELLGTAIAREQVKAIFDRLRFSYEEQGDHLLVTAPTRRPDISIEVDLIEEVARLYGYDNIPKKLLEGRGTIGRLTGEQKVKRNIRRTLQGLGLNEVVTYALTSPEKAQEVASLHEDVRPVRLQLPMSEARSELRTGLLPHLIEAAEYNAHRQQERVALFELGRTFTTEEEELTELPQETEELAGIFYGPRQTPDWLEKEKQLDFYAVKGVLDALFARLGIEGTSYVTREYSGFHPGRTAEIRLGDTSLGCIGQLHPHVAAAHDLPDCYAFQLQLKPIYKAATADTVRYAALPRYPAVTRDMAVVVDRGVPVAALVETIKRTGRQLESVAVFDVFTGIQIGSDKKSVAFSLVYRDPVRTLTDDEISAQHKEVVEALRAQHGAKLR